MLPEQGWDAWARYWRCECGATVVCPAEPPLCPETEAHVPGPRPQFTRIPRPASFDFLVLPETCRKCGGAMVATHADATNVLACAQCAVCGWRWFLRPEDVEGVQDRFPRDGKKAR